MSPSTSPSEPGKLRELLPTSMAPLRATAFYAAVGLPFAYLPLLASGVAAERLPLLFGLLAANAVALVAGHDYNRR